MSTVAISKNNVKAVRRENKGSLVQRFQKYVLDNAEFFANAAAGISGRSAMAAQIERTYAKYAETEENK